MYVSNNIQSPGMKNEDRFNKNTNSLNHNKTIYKNNKYNRDEPTTNHRTTGSILTSERHIKYVLG